MRIPAPHATLVLAAGTAHTFAETTTMIELPKAQFGRLLPLFNPEPPHATMIYSALEGRTPARAYLDAGDQPTQCLLVTNFLNFTFVGGAPDPHWLAQAISTLRCEHDLWSTGLHARQRGRRLPRRRFPLMVARRARKLDCRPLPRTPTPGHQLQLVNGALFARRLWHDEIVMAFGTAENFLRHGIGLCLTAGEETCSEAYAVWRGAGRFEIGIVTAGSAPRPGMRSWLASISSGCVAAGQPTCWGCFQDNVASAALAQARLPGGARRRMALLRPHGCYGAKPRSIRHDRKAQFAVRFPQCDLDGGRRFPRAKIKPR